MKKQSSTVDRFLNKHTSLFCRFFAAEAIEDKDNSDADVNAITTFIRDVIRKCGYYSRISV